jgi:putative membrane protein
MNWTRIMQVSSIPSRYVLPRLPKFNFSFPRGRKMMKLLIRLLINMLAILAIAYVFPGLVWVDTVWSALAAAFLLGIVNAVIRPIFILLTLPLTLVTLGLFLLVINALMLWMVSGLVGGFYVGGFWGAFFGSILISLVSWILSRVIIS